MDARDGDERELLQKAQDGDRAARDELFARYEDRIKNFCLSKLRDEQLAWDATRDTFDRAARYLHNFRRDAQLSTWLSRIAVNVCIDALNRSRRRATVPLEPDQTIDPRSSIMQRVDVALIVDTLSKSLDDREFQIFALTCEGQKPQEIARLMGMPGDVVRQLLFKLRKKARELFPEYFPKSGA